MPSASKKNYGNIEKCLFCAVEFQQIRKGDGVYCSRQCYWKNKKTDTVKRFWGKVKKGKGCWEWQGTLFNTGYGAFWDERNNIGAHKKSLEMALGKKVTDFVCHKCDNPPCVRPSHLFVGTMQDNLKDMISKKRNVRRERHPMAKLTEKKVDEIRKLYKTGEYRQKDLGDMFSVCQATIWYALKNITWNEYAK